MEIHKKYTYINSSITYLSTKLYTTKKEEHLIHDSFYIQETSYTQNEKQLLHHGAYQSK